MKKQKRILVLCSAATQIPMREGGYHPTGNFLGELTEPLEMFLEKKDFAFTFATPGGRPISIDENSFKLMYWSFSKKNLNHGRAIFDSLLDLGLKNPVPLEELASDERNLREFDCLFIPGGHGPMVDLLHEDFNVGPSFNLHTSLLLQHFHNESKITSLICHGPAVLACAPEQTGEWIYKDYRMTCVSQFAEWLTEDFLLTKVIHGHLREYPTHLLRGRGAKIEQVLFPMISKVVRDRELVTGQDPYSGKALGRELFKILKD